MRKKMFFTMAALVMMLAGCSSNDAEVTEGNSISIYEEITVQEGVTVEHAISVEQAANAEQTTDIEKMTNVEQKADVQQTTSVEQVTDIELMTDVETITETENLNILDTISADIVLCDDMLLWESIEIEAANGLYRDFETCEVVIDKIRHKAVYHASGILIVDNVYSDLKEDTYTVYCRDKKLVVPAEYSLGYEWIDIGFKKIGEAKRECLFIGGRPNAMCQANLIDMESFELIKTDYEVEELEKGLKCTIETIEVSEPWDGNFVELKAEILIEDNYGNAARVTTDKFVFDYELKTGNLEAYEWDVVFVPNVTKYVDTNTQHGNVMLYLAYKDKEDNTEEYVLEKYPNIELSFVMKYNENSNSYMALFDNVMIKWLDKEKNLSYSEVLYVNNSEENN